MTRILGIDTATTGCSAAIMDAGGTCLAAETERMARGQSEALMPMIANVLNGAGLAVADLDAIAVTRGPGAFTGLRIGLAAARAAALAAHIPCLGIGTFEALRAQARQWDETPGPVLVAVESKREDLYLCLFDAAGAPMGAGATAAVPETVPAMIEGLEGVRFVGDGAARAARAAAMTTDAGLLEATAVADAKVVASLGFDCLSAPERAPADPIYLRPPDVTLPA